MQEEEYHNTHGRGRNISCSNIECKNFGKKIGRSRGALSNATHCPICKKLGREHNYNSIVLKNGIVKDRPYRFGHRFGHRKNHT